MMDIYDDRDISTLAKILNLKEKEEDFSSKRRKVHRILVDLIKHAGKFSQRDTYSQEEIEAIYKKRGIDLDTRQIIEKGFVCSGSVYNFGSTADDKGNLRYKLYEMELCED